MTDDITRHEPHDITTEQALLGAILLAHDPRRALRDLDLDPAEYYRPAHAIIHGAIAGLAATAEPIDPHTVSAALQAQGALDRVGGRAYLHTCIDAAQHGGTPSWLTARIRDLSVRRQLIHAGHQIAADAQAFDPDGDASELAEHAVAKIRNVRDAGRAVTDSPVQDMLDFLATEDSGYDWVLPGYLEHTDRVIWTAGEGGGKALALDTPIPTPKGWSTMGALTIGQEIFAPDGTVTRIIAATDIMHDRPCYQLNFSDGAQITADAGHLWLTETLAARETAADQSRRGQTKPRGTDQRHKLRHAPAIVTTKQIAETVKARGGHAVNHSIVTSAPLRYPAQELTIDPYALGAWLGDGTSCRAQITCHPDDAEIIEHIRTTEGGVHKLGARYLWGISEGRRPGRRIAESFQVRLRNIGVLNDKHIPEDYQRSSVEQRLALLQGLMDTDGTVSDGATKSGRGSGMAKCEFSVVNERLARDVHELILGLGIKAAFRSGPAKLDGRIVGTRYRLTFQTDLPVFRLQRKADRLAPLRTRRARLRYIESAEPVSSVPVRCIQVDRPDGMFVAGRECIPTHNSFLQRQIAVAAAAGRLPFGEMNGLGPQRVLVLDCENSDRQSRRQYGTLVKTAEHLGTPIERGRLHIDIRPEGVDLTRADGRAWLMRRVEAVMPDLLIVGPIYRLHNGDPNSEEHARKVTVVLDEARATARCALSMEAHSPQGGNLGPRALRPVGSSLWLRWPEFGMGLRPVEDERSAHDDRARRVIPWRGARDERAWPRFIRQGDSGNWPWRTYQPIDADQFTGHSPTGAVL